MHTTALPLLQSTISVARVLDPRGYSYYVSFLGVANKGDVPQLTIVTDDNLCNTAFAPAPMGTDHTVSTLESGAQLTPGTLYYVRVRAVNSVGAGEPTPAKRVTDLTLVSEVPRARPGVPMYVQRACTCLCSLAFAYALHGHEWGIGPSIVHRCPPLPPVPDCTAPPLPQQRDCICCPR
jgi:hypothetical protein